MRQVCRETFRSGMRLCPAQDRRRFAMDLVYLCLGFVGGGISALMIMAMLFVAKRADDNDDHVGASLTPVVPPR